MTLQLSELQAIKRQWLDADPEPDDPIEKLFWLRKLPPNARMRAMYAATRTAKEPIAKLERKIADLTEKLQGAIWRVRARFPNGPIAVDAPIPTYEQAQQVAADEAYIKLLRHHLESSEAQLPNFRQRLSEAQRDWDATYAQWGGLIYALENDARFLAPGALVAAYKKPSAMDRGNLVAALQEIEK